MLQLKQNADYSADKINCLKKNRSCKKKIARAKKNRATWRAEYRIRPTMKRNDIILNLYAHNNNDNKELQEIVSQVPNEIWKTILYHSLEWDNEQTLRQYAMVCSAWWLVIVPELRARLCFVDSPARSNWVLSQFPDIEVLDLSGNYTIIDETLLRLPNLNCLIIFDNKKVTPRGIIQLSKLSSLVLDNVKYISDGFKNLTNLTSLRICDTDFSTLRPKLHPQLPIEIKHLTNLTYLD